MATTPDQRIAVHLTGHLRRPQLPGGDITASDILHDYLSGTFDPNVADGGFVGCIVDLNAGRLQIFNDRLGTLPVLYGSNERGFAFGPEAKAVLAMLDLSPRYRTSGVVSFLTAGYCLGDETLFEDVHCLEPGSILSVDLRTLQVSTSRYWKMSYVANKALTTRKAASAALRDVILQSHETLLGSPAEPFDILLSGGLDSRSMLAAVTRAGRKPKRAFGWGMRDDIPYSDPYIASRMAARFGVRYDFCRYDTDAFAGNAAAWSRLSELANDNIGWYAEGASALTESYDPSVAYTLVGDETWGWGGAPTTTDEMIAEVLPPEAAPRLRELATPQMRDDCQALYRTSISRVLRDADCESLADRKDFLYLHGRVARFIFPLGYYKEFAVQVRRPLMTRATLEVISGLPAELRYHKNLYRFMLEDHFPELRGIPRNLANSLPDWRHDTRTRPGLRDFFTQLLSRRTLENSSLSALLRAPDVEARWQQFLQAPSSPVRRSPGKLRLIAHSLVPERVHIHRSARGALSGSSRSDMEFFRALALLVLLETQFGQLHHRGEAAPVTGSPLLVRV